MSDLVTISVEGHIADVRLNRPDKYNAISPEMFQALNDAGTQLLEADDVRAVVLSGNGPGFCSGLDMGSFQGMADRAENRDNESSRSSDVPVNRTPTAENSAQRAAYVWRRLPMPVIAAIHGVAYGGGCQIALAADIRFADPSAKMSVLEIKWGLIPDMSITQTLRQTVRMDVAKELTFTGRILNAEEAQRLGLVTHVTENPREAALELAQEIAGRSPTAVRAGKHLYETTWHAADDAGFGLEAKLQTGLIGSPNQVEAIKANFENRDPQFPDSV
ncbi:MAG: crotonase/enoyl-CoA hydratase family protein [Gammaproteobacteria bacterium]|nr:crotonase/enoyl-CoA hydratase family protein [Gammaproteobacteria bacterium]